MRDGKYEATDASADRSIPSEQVSQVAETEPEQGSTCGHPGHSTARKELRQCAIELRGEGGDSTLRWYLSAAETERNDGTHATTDLHLHMYPGSIAVVILH